MRATILIMFAAIAITSCNSSPNSLRVRAKESDRLRCECEQAIQNAYQSSERNLNIMLGFQFGMTSDDVADHFAVLRNSGKIYTTNNYGPTYDLATEHGEIVCSFGAEYFQGGLSGIYLYLQKTKNIDPELDFPGVRKLGAMALFQKRTDLEMYISPGDDYYFINGNIVIEITDSPQARIYYYDAPAKKREAEIEREKKDKAVQRSADDL